MSLAVYPALFFTVALLVTNAYFLMGGLPLLVLDHSTSLDARFVRGFFNIYYKAAFVNTLGACLSFAALGRPVYAAGAVLLALTLVLLRSKLVQAMAQWGSQIQVSGRGAIWRFRQVHLMALLVNLLQLILLVWALIKLSL
jgi:hypothetical protein